jgi:hypothetical protein
MSDKAKFRDYLNVYNFTCELPGTGEEIEFKPITTGQLKRLLTYENETNPVRQEKAIDELIRMCIITEGYDPDTMFLEDRFFFLIQIRKKSKGEVLEFTNKCKECESQSLIKLSLDDLPTIARNPEENPEVELSSGIKVKLKHVTRKEQKQIKQDVFKGLNNTQKSAEMQIYVTALGINSVTTPEYGEETELALEDKKYLVENIPTNEFEKLRNWYNDNFFGIDFKTEMKCFHCGYGEEIEIPMDSAFFF